MASQQKQRQVQTHDPPDGCNGTNTMTITIGFYHCNDCVGVAKSLIALTLAQCPRGPWQSHGDIEVPVAEAFGLILSSKSTQCRGGDFGD